MLNWWLGNELVVGSFVFKRVCLLHQIVVFIALNCALLSQKVNAHEDNLSFKVLGLEWGIYLSTVISNKRLVSSCPVLLVGKTLLKFIYSEMGTKFCEIFPLILTTVHTVKSKWKISQNFVAFSECMNFNFGFKVKHYFIFISVLNFFCNLVNRSLHFFCNILLGFYFNSRFYYPHLGVTFKSHHYLCIFSEKWLMQKILLHFIGVTSHKVHITSNFLMTWQM